MTKNTTTTPASSSRDSVTDALGSDIARFYEGVEEVSALNDDDDRTEMRVAITVFVATMLCFVGLAGVAIWAVIALILHFT